MRCAKMKNSVANNTLWYKSWNDDYRVDGIYHELGSSEFRVIVILQSYSDNEGYVRDPRGMGYNMSILCDMVGINPKTLRIALIILEEKGMISMDEDKVIRLNHFIDDNVYRDNNNHRATAAKRQWAQKQAAMEKDIRIIAENVANPIVVDGRTGEYQKVGIEDG